jgi:hypothetical protein
MTALRVVACVVALAALSAAGFAVGRSTVNRSVAPLRAVAAAPLPTPTAGPGLVLPPKAVIP